MIVRDLNNDNPYICELFLNILNFIFKLLHVSVLRCDVTTPAKSYIPSPDPNLQVRIILESWNYTTFGKDILEDSLIYLFI